MDNQSNLRFENLQHQLSCLQERVAYVEERLTISFVDKPEASPGKTMEKSAGEFKNRVEQEEAKPDPVPLESSQISLAAASIERECIPNTRVTVRPALLEEPTVCEMAQLQDQQVELNTQRTDSLRPPIEPAGKKGSLEMEIGLYWLNRLGISSLVIGVALFLMYSFQYFGPVAKICTGLAVAISLLGGGEWMERRGGPKWYARSLMGGGWSVAYFTVFAMYHIESVKVLDNLTLDWLLLNGVSIGAMWHCVKKRSEVTALLSLVLALVSFSLSEISIATALATAVLVNALCTLAVKLGWSRLYFWGVLGSYAAFHFTVADKILALPLDAHGKTLLSVLYLCVFWLPYLVTSLFLSEKSIWRRNLLICAACLNAIAFAPDVITAMKQIFDAGDYITSLSIGIVYAFAARTAKNKQFTGISDVYTLAALSLATLSIPMMIHVEWKNLVWLLEIPLVVFIGLKYRLSMFRFFGFVLLPVTLITTLALSVSGAKFELMGFSFPTILIHTSCAAISYGLAAAAYRWWRTKEGIQSEYSGFSFYVYLFASAVACWSIPAWAFQIGLPGKIAMPITVASSICVVCWMLQSSALLLLALRCKDKLLLKCSALAFKLSAINTLLVPQPFAAAHIAAASIIYGAAAMIRIGGAHLPEEVRQNHFRIYLTIASLLLWYVTKEYFGAQFPILWLMEASATICLGMWLKERYVEKLGGLGFLVLYFHLLFDMSNRLLIEAVTIVGVTYGVSAAYRALAKAESSPLRINYARCYEAFAALAMTLIIHQHVPDNCLAFAWSLEGLLLLIMGFVLSDRLSRLYGLGVFAMVGGKLLFVDLAQADTPQRILSFVVAGAVLLIASYAYSMFEKKFVESTSAECDRDAETVVVS